MPSPGPTFISRVRRSTAPWLPWATSPTWSRPLSPATREALPTWPRRPPLSAVSMRDGITAVRRAALVHDLGRVAVHPRVWLRPGPLTADDWEQVRLHPYHTERVLSRSSFLAPLSGCARAHHERLDGTGYHRGVAAPSLSASDRLLAAADSFRAMTESRPHRGGVAPEEAARRLVEEARAGRLDADIVSAVCEAAGQPGPRPERPAGLTEREAEVIGLLGRGLQTKQVASPARHLRQDRRPSHPERLPEDGGVYPRPGRRSSRWNTG